MTNRWDIINHLIKQNDYKTYLEIGYYKGWSFDRVEAKFKTAVDPNPSKVEDEEKMEYGNFHCMTFSNGEYCLVKKTSDDFFSNLESDKKFDIIFIDGLHESEQVYRDIQNSLSHLSEGGTVVMHDCNPPLYEHTTTGIDGCWTGDTYKAVLKFRDMTSGIWNFKCVDTDWGVGIIQKEKEEIDLNVSFAEWFAYRLKPNQSEWEFFDEYRKDLLSLISVEDFYNKNQIKNAK